MRLFKSTASPISDSETETPPHEQLQMSIENDNSNCWTDCDFPSECHNFRLERLRAARAAAKLSLKQKIQRETKPGSGSIKAELEIESQPKEMFEEEESEFLEATSGFEGDIVMESERRGQENEAELEMVDMPIASNVSSTSGTLPEFPNRDFVIDAIEEEEREVEFVEKKRRKSILKIHQLTGLMLGTDVDLKVGESHPTSPLKKSFGQDELVGVMVSEADQNGDEVQDVPLHKRKERRVLQLEELLRTRSDFQRIFDENEEDEFGDVSEI